MKIERKAYFTKYGFIPAPDGSFYDIGFGFLLDNISAVIDTIINQLLDAGTLSNMQGGFLGGGGLVLHLDVGVFALEGARQRDLLPLPAGQLARVF